MTSQNPIDALLEAEQGAEAEIERNRDARHETVSQALGVARTISERAHRRITKIHTRCTASVKMECDDMWHSYEEGPKTVNDDMATAMRLERIAVQVAAQLTGGGQDGASAPEKEHGPKQEREPDV